MNDNVLPTIWQVMKRPNRRVMLTLQLSDVGSTLMVLLPDSE